MILLTLCIATLNRGKFIGETLDSIIPQLNAEVELLIVDGNSSDDTQEIVGLRAAGCTQLRYVRELVNSGVDADYDKAVSYARGEYCWLMTDDDVLLPDAVATILECLRSNPALDLCVLNAAVANVDLSKRLQERLLGVSGDQDYSDRAPARFFLDVCQHLKFIGAVVARREWWLSRDRTSYYGTLFVHVGVVFQNPPVQTAMVISKPVMVIRYGNAMWTPRAFEIWMFLWPKLVWSFDSFSEAERSRVCAKEPWRQLAKLGMHRATGGYTSAEYDRFFKGKVAWWACLPPWVMATVPASWVNVLASVYSAMLGKRARLNLYDLVRSKHASWATRAVARLSGI